ncbi:MAG: tetratricopeptide repeat protein [Pirellula sp.]|nr:tetratricopeptide repeat protein [Pirellula sp.]
MSSGEGRNWIPWVSVLVAALAVALSFYQLSLLRETMERQAELSDWVVELQKQPPPAVSKPVPDAVEKPVLQTEESKRNAPDAEESPSEARRSSLVQLVVRPLQNSLATLEDELEEVASRLQAQYPASADALHVVGMMKAQTRHYSEAQAMWKECIRLEPKQELHYINLASIAMEQGDNELALNTLRQGVALGFDSFDMAHHLALALSNLGIFEEASQVLEASLKRFPAEGSHWLLLGQAQMELGKISESEASFRRAMELGVQTPSLYVGLGNACLRQGKRAEAKEYLEKYAELKKQDNLSGQERYQVLSDQEIRRTAKSIFTEAAAVYFKQKDALEAERLLLRCVAMDPESLSALRALADLYFQSKQTIEERDVRERIIELGSEAFQDYLALAKVHASLGDRTRAEATLKMAVSVFPQRIEPYAGLAEFCLEGGKLPEARWYAQKSIERMPSPEGFLFLASICDKLKDERGAAEARKYAKQLSEQKSESR